MFSSQSLTLASTLVVPASSNTSSPSPSPSLEENEQFLIAPPFPDSLLAAWTLPPSSPLSPFNYHRTAAPPADLPVDIDLSTLSDHELPVPKLSLTVMPEHDDTYPENMPSSPLVFAPAPSISTTASRGTRSSKRSMTLGLSKVERMLGTLDALPASKGKRRPPALHQRSVSSDPPDGDRRKGAAANVIGSATGRHSFIDLDDATPSRDSYGDSDDVNPNAMYPTPTRATFRPLSRADTVRSTSSQLPQFNSPDGDDCPYQPLPHQSRRRPKSMLISPNAPIPADVQGNNDSDDYFHYTGPVAEHDRSKPPLPNSRKPPQLLRKAVAASSPPSPRYTPHYPHQQALPPTTNTRGASERQELVRKHRKLAQVFGEGVSGVLGPNDDVAQLGRARGWGAVPPRSQHRRGSLSTGGNDDVREQLFALPPLRRYSTPTSTEFREYVKAVQSVQAEGGDGNGNGNGNGARTGAGGGATITRGQARGSGSPESFMELSDDEPDTTTTTTTTTTTRLRLADDDLSIRTLGHNDDPEVAAAEQDRKKMREKLAKLHRFLGSRVPVELALGAEYVFKEQDLPRPAGTASAPTRAFIGGMVTVADNRDGNVVKDGGKKWKRRRRSSSSGALPGYTVVHSRALSKGGEAGDVLHLRGGGCTLAAASASAAAEERMKDELGGKERALNLKRANKMEQVCFVCLLIVACLW